jgi:hypothetical protein
MKSEVTGDWLPDEDLLDVFKLINLNKRMKKQLRK